MFQIVQILQDNQAALQGILHWEKLLLDMQTVFQDNVIHQSEVQLQDIRAVFQDMPQGKLQSVVVLKKAQDTQIVFQEIKQLLYLV